MQTPIKYLIGAVFALSLLVGTTSCISQNFESGTPLSAEKISQIKKGVTTRAEVEALFGPPAYISMMPDGKRSLSYNYTSSKTDAHATAATYIPLVGPFVAGGKAQSQTRVQMLQVLLNADGIVEDYQFSDNTNNVNATTGGLMGLSTTGTSTTTGTEEKK